MEVDFHDLDKDHLWLQPLILDLRHISADVDPDMPLFPDIYGFEGLPTFRPEIAIFRTGVAGN